MPNVSKLCCCWAKQHVQGSIHIRIVFVTISTTEPMGDPQNRCGFGPGHGPARQPRTTTSISEQSGDTGHTPPPPPQVKNPTLGPFSCYTLKGPGHDRMGAFEPPWLNRTRQQSTVTRPCCHGQRPDFPSKQHSCQRLRRQQCLLLQPPPPHPPHSLLCAATAAAAAAASSQPALCRRRLALQQASHDLV